MTDDGRTEAELLAATARGDGESFAVLVRRYVRAATLLAAQFVGDPDEAKDVVQDAFVVVFRDAGTFDASRSFAPWMYAIVRRLAANRRTRYARRNRLLRLFGEGTRWATTSHSPEDALLARVDASTAQRAMEGLSPMQRACFELVAVRGLSTEEVASMHDIAESTVRQHVFRARASLRAVLDPQRPAQDE